MIRNQADENCHIDLLTQKGNIQKIDSRNYYISISAVSACSSCHSKGVCNVTEMKEKIIEVPLKPGENFKEGDVVEVLMKKSLGTKAVIIGYIVPFILLLISLLAALKIFDSDGIAGLISISVLALYYVVLYFFREKIRQAFTFSIRS
jgi:sigma-E factor negative regulatory protein RseC